MITNHSSPQQNQSIDERMAKLMQQKQDQLSPQEREATLHELLELYANLVDADKQKAQQLRQAFLLALRSEANILDKEPFSHFLAEHIQPADFEGIKWQTADQCLQVAEALYFFQNEATHEKVTPRIYELIRSALRYFEQQRDYEQMFELFRLTPIPLMEMDQELLRLRNRVYLYEMRRVQHFRRLLYGYLIVQAVLILFVFPLLFIYVENGAIASAIEETADVDLPTQARQYLSYADGVYWAIITAASIGYGDITPVTGVGKVIAAILGTMGVITIGIVAGLILGQITPRRLE